MVLGSVAPERARATAVEYDSLLAILIVIGTSILTDGLLTESQSFLVRQGPLVTVTPVTTWNGRTVANTITITSHAPTRSGSAVDTLTFTIRARDVAKLQTAGALFAAYQLPVTHPIKANFTSVFADGRSVRGKLRLLTNIQRGTNTPVQVSRVDVWVSPEHNDDDDND
jgi:hypothetical protein